MSWLPSNLVITSRAYIIRQFFTKQVSEPRSTKQQHGSNRFHGRTRTAWMERGDAHAAWLVRAGSRLPWLLTEPQGTSPRWPWWSSATRRSSAPPGNRRGRIRRAAWSLCTLLTVLFAWRVAAVMPNRPAAPSRLGHGRHHLARWLRRLVPPTPSASLRASSDSEIVAKKKKKN